MNKILFIVSIITTVFLTSVLCAQEITKKPETHQKAETSYYRGSLGILGGVTMAGIHAEYTPVPEIGVRAVGLCIFGADFNDMNRDEYILSGIITPVLHLAPESGIVDPFLMFGLVYSFHHWTTRATDAGINRATTIRQGNLHDVTCGLGLGILFKFAGRLTAGLNLWLNIDYGVETTTSFRKKKGNRILLPVPLAEFSVRF